MTKVRTAPKPKPAPRNRPAINFTTDPSLHSEAEAIATLFGLFTAQGGEERPRVSAILNGLMLLLKRGQIPLSRLYDAACEAANLEPDVEIQEKLTRKMAA